MDEQSAALAFPAGRQYLGRREHLAAAGLSNEGIAKALAAGHIERVRRGVYTPGPLPPRGRHLVTGGMPDGAYVAETRAALMSLGPTAMAGGRTAAVLWGFDMFVEPNKIEVVVAESRSRKPLSGVQISRHREAVGQELEVLGLDPLRALTPLATVLHCALTRPLTEAVVIADSALRSGRVELAELQRAVGAWGARAGGPRLRGVVELVDPASESVLESLTRLLFVLRGVIPESQVRLFTASGAPIGRVDFLFPEHRLVVECDGRRWHDPGDAREKDRVRDNELERAAYRLIRLTWGEVVHHPDQVVRLVQDCMSPWPLAA